MRYLFLIFITLAFEASSLASETYTITGDVIFKKDGDIYIRICKLKEWAEFLRPNYELSVPPWKLIKFNTEERERGKVSFKLDNIPSGTYVIVAFQDVNKNQRVDYEGLHMKEPWGTYKEDDYLSNRPRWDIVKFELKKNIEGITIQI